MQVPADALMPAGDGRIATAVLGTTDAATVSEDLGSLCRVSLHSAPRECIWVRLSVGVAFALVLDDGSIVVVKAHGPRKSGAYLNAMRRVQEHLWRSGFPAPAPVAGPVSFGLGHAVIDGFLDGDVITNAKDPACRAAMATTLAGLVQSARTVDGREALGERRWPQGLVELWPTPHNALFDFEASAPGAEWIDELAEQSLRILSTSVGPMVVGHGDWSAHNLRMRHGAVCAVYDWDSLVLDREPSVVGGAAAHFSHDGAQEDWVPTPEDAAHFIDDYELARGNPFSTSERTAAAAATLYGLAYTARCEHAINWHGDEHAGARGALAEHLNAYLSI
jgi:hypothetical protein